ncbi:cell shape determination protein CcmA [Candidatus Bipolaricaulota bacterium]|nr:cell shape determination protein CcmA [Candidatus Bipolaricaulota bacterium]
MSEEKKSVSVTGAGVITGGSYSRVSISGAGKIVGDVYAENLTMSGAGRVSGHCEVVLLTVSGTGTFDKDVIADEMKVSGVAKVNGQVKVKELKCSGTFKAAESISSEYVKVSGMLHVSGDVEAEIFRASGGFDVGGLLSADRIEIHPGGRCRAQEIGGAKIDIRRYGSRERAGLLDSLLRALSSSWGGDVEAALIEGDEIYLENTRADVVRGKQIQIGPDCKIGLIEYSESLKIHDDSEVQKQNKI